MLDLASTEADWIRAFHLYREGALFTALRGHIDDARMALLERLLRDTDSQLKKGRRRSNASTSALANLRRLPPLDISGPFCWDVAGVGQSRTAF